MAKQSKHGGRRAKSGRKPVDDPKIQVSLYIQKSRIDGLGLDELKEIAMTAIERACKKLK
jgi:hypothetical protein